MFSSLFNWFKGLFGKNSVNDVVKVAKIAGLFVAANNPAYMPLAKVALERVQAYIANDVSGMVINQAFKEVLDMLVKNVSDKAKILAVATILDIDMKEAVSIPNVEIPLIEDAVRGFLEGFTLEA